MIIKRFMLIAIFLSPALVQAASITWNVNLIFSSPAATVTGTYDFDASTGFFTGIDVTAASPQFVPNPSVYDAAWDAPYSTASMIDFYTTGGMAGKYAMVIELEEAMTDTRDVINVATLTTFLCVDAGCDDYSVVTVYNNSNDFTGTVSSVPLPAAAWLFGSALFGLIGVTRRKKLNA
jgi:hypothetical protein